jgi:hypothetical protein
MIAKLELLVFKHGGSVGALGLRFYVLESWDSIRLSMQISVNVLFFSFFVTACYAPLLVLGS